MAWTSWKALCVYPSCIPPYIPPTQSETGPCLSRIVSLPYIDQGERSFAFEINGGDSEERREFVTREAVVFQEKPMAVPASPSGEGEKGTPVILVDNPAVVLGAFRKGTANDCYLLRLYESSGKKADSHSKPSALGLELPLPWEPAR